VTAAESSTTAGGASSKGSGDKPGAAAGAPSAIGGVLQAAEGGQLMHIPGVPGSLALVWTGEAEEEETAQGTLSKARRQAAHSGEGYGSRGTAQQGDQKGGTRAQGH